MSTIVSRDLRCVYAGRASSWRIGGHLACDERVETFPELAFPGRHGRDVGLDGGVAVALGDLRVAARKQDGLAVPALARGICPVHPFTRSPAIPAPALP